MYTKKELETISLVLKREIETLTANQDTSIPLAEWLEIHDEVIDYVNLRRKTKQLIKTEEEAEISW